MAKAAAAKIVDYFEINLNRCILCGICVEYCNFDAIVMSHEHEMSTYARNGDRVDMPALLQIGKKYQDATGWIPADRLGQAKSRCRQSSRAIAADVTDADCRLAASALTSPAQTEERRAQRRRTLP